MSFATTIYARLAMKWAILFSAVLSVAVAEIVVKPDGMLNLRIASIASDSCSLPKDFGSAVQKVDENEGIFNRTQLYSGTCGSHNERRSLRISGGNIYPANEYPFISALVRCSVSSGNQCQPFCGGSILTRSHVLTAAHCTDNLHKATLFVLVGAYDINSGKSTSIQVRSITRHPAYDGITLMNDIAVLTLATPVSFSKNVGPVCLPTSDPEVGEEVKILGWGADTYKGPMSPKPKEMNTNVFSIAECSRQWKMCVRPTKPIQLCTLSKDAAPCQGDSGGPVVWLDPQNRYRLVGIVSFGPQCTETKAAVHTKVTSFLPWIQQQTQVGI